METYYFNQNQISNQSVSSPLKISNILHFNNNIHKKLQAVQCVPINVVNGKITDYLKTLAGQIL